MVGRLMLLKMLHCKFHRRNKLTRERISDDKVLKTPLNNLPVKEEYNEQESGQTTCRVCLKSGNIYIYGSEDISDDLSNFGGIVIDPGDKYPKFLCKACHSLLQGAILLRKTAQQSNELLQQTQNDFLCDYEDIINNGNDSDYKDDNNTEENIDYKCKKCDITFSSFKDYSDHRISQDHENKRQTCPICKNSYSSLYFKRHLALHKLDSPYMCEICGKKFIVKGQLTRHRVTHFNNLPFKCTLCPYKGRFRESLKMHMRSHTGEKPYQCIQCPSRFVNKSNLNKHMLTHKGNHDHKCDSCGRAFYTKRELDLHFKVDHSGIKDHICNVCGKAFGYRKQMMKHQLKVHKRQKLQGGRMPLYLQIESKSNKTV